MCCNGTLYFTDKNHWFFVSNQIIILWRVKNRTIFLFFFERGTRCINTYVIFQIFLFTGIQWINWRKRNGAGIPFFFFWWSFIKRDELFFSYFLFINRTKVSRGHCSRSGVNLITIYWIQALTFTNTISGSVE